MKLFAKIIVTPPQMCDRVLNKPRSDTIPHPYPLQFEGGAGDVETIFARYSTACSCHDGPGIKGNSCPEKLDVLQGKYPQLSHLQKYFPFNVFHSNRQGSKFVRNDRTLKGLFKNIYFLLSLVVFVQMKYGRSLTKFEIKMTF